MLSLSRILTEVLTLTQGTNTTFVLHGIIRSLAELKEPAGFCPLPRGNHRSRKAACSYIIRSLQPDGVPGTLSPHPNNPVSNEGLQYSNSGVGVGIKKKLLEHVFNRCLLERCWQSSLWKEALTLFTTGVALAPVVLAPIQGWFLQPQMLWDSPWGMHIAEA